VPIDLDETARRIVVARAEGHDFEVIDGLDLATAYDIQDRVAALSAPIGGYKISWNAPGLPEKFGLNAAGVARVEARHLREDNVVLRRSDFVEPMLEPEICATLGSDIPHRSTAWTAEAIAPYIADFKPCFEVLDRRNVSAPHGESIVASNVFNAGAVIGGPGAVQSSDTGVDLSVGGEALLASANATAPQHPLDAIAYVANLMTPRGAPMSAGMVILCGSHCGLIPIDAGQEAVFSITDLGKAALSMV
jgi:2-keto-4-pentenoate hydratase